ncbi:MAG: hypothetical protein RMJ56_07560 [Gemmataceae bacterium]|nr:hypothetical protein [Gemmata sp.]MDW8197447.1 hypothetical protein [Gemmataceae bacterium]
MNVRLLRLSGAIFFLLCGVGLLVFRYGLPEVAARFDPLRLALGTGLAFLLAGWNFAKWYASLVWYRQRTTPRRPPLQPQPTSDDDRRYHPEFDFHKLPDAKERAP